MAAGDMLVTRSIDYEKNGKQISHLCITAQNDGAEVEVRIPLAVMKNGAGPTVLLNGGSHGDEFEGPLALTKLVRSLNYEDIQGRVIVIPALNLPALLSGVRCSPIDGLDMNRSFPGDAEGSVTSAIANYIHREIVPRVDAVYDIHAGGNAFFVIPSVFIHPLPQPGLMGKTFDALQALRLPASVLIEEPGRERMFDYAVETAGKVFASAELGGGGCITPESLRRTESTILNFLRHFRILPGDSEAIRWRGRETTQFLEVPTKDWYVKAQSDGLYEPLLSPGDDIRAGHVIGRIYDVQTPLTDPIAVTSPADGIVFFQRASGLVDRGKPVSLIARQTSRERILSHTSG